MAIQTSLVLIGGSVWLRAGRPSLRYLLPNRWRFPAGWLRIVRDWLPVVLLGLGVAAAFMLGAVLIVVVAPNNNDALTSHLSRIGYWLQHRSFFPWPTLRLSQTIYPVNASLQVYWTVLFWGTDQLAGFVQWVGGIITILSVFGLARLLGWSRLQSTFAAFVWGSFPLVLLQSTTAKLDLVAAGIFLPVIYFLVLGVRRENQAMLVYSGLSLALAIGTKQTLWFLLPGLGLFALILLGYWRRHVQHLLAWLGATAVFFVVLSAYMFVVNEVNYKTPVGPADIVSEQSIRLTSASVAQALVYNIPRFAYQAVDFSGFPEKARQFAYKAKGKLASLVIHWIGFPIEGTVSTAPNHSFDLRYQTPITEDESWFGILGVLLLFPAAILEFIAAIRKKDAVIIGMFVFGLTFLPVNILFRPGWDPYQGRYFITAAGVLAPFMARWVQRRNIYKVAVWISVVIGLTTVYNIMVYNPAKPLRSDRLNSIMIHTLSKPLQSNWFNIFRASRMITQGLDGGGMQDYMKMVYGLPESTTIAYYATTPIWDYPLFGQYFTRTVIPLTSLGDLQDASRLSSQGIEYVLIYLPDAPGILQIDPRLQEYARQDDQWVVYKLELP